MTSSQSSSTLISTSSTLSDTAPMYVLKIMRECLLMLQIRPKDSTPWPKNEPCLNANGADSVIVDFGDWGSKNIHRRNGKYMCPSVRCAFVTEDADECHVRELILFESNKLTAPWPLATCQHSMPTPRQIPRRHVLEYIAINKAPYIVRPYPPLLQRSHCSQQ